jgi:hypothetical protein
MTNPNHDDRNSDLATIRTFINELEANLAKSVLEAAGIRCMLSRDDCAGQRPSLTMANGIRLIVNSSDASWAKQVLTHELQD